MEEFAGGESRAIEPECSNCGADVKWDPKADALLCEHCGHKQQVPRAEGLIEERPLEEAGGAARGLGLETRASRCANCGARVAFGRSETSKLCVFCGSPNILAHEENRNAIRPESLIPLDVSRKTVAAQFHKWIKSRWFRPNALKKLKTFEATGVYVPAWTYDCDVFSEWSADAGYYYYVTETYTVTVNGKPQTRTRQVRKVRWVPKWGSRSDRYNDIQIVASHGVRPDLVAELGAFNTRELVPYRPEYLAGWVAEEYQVDLLSGWAKAKGVVRRTQLGRCSGDVPGDTQRNLSVRNTISNVLWKHVLFPMWTVSYVYAGKPYAVLVHGQNGKIVGKAPYSWVKITLLVLLLLVVIAVIAIVYAGRGAR